MDKKLIVEYLVRQGLSEHLILNSFKGKAYLGNVLYDKNKLFFKDLGLFEDIDTEKLKPCWESGLMGMIIPNDKKKPWESLTFLGIDKCQIQADFSASRHGVLISTSNQYGNSLNNFEGSIYRGFHLMLDNHFLPVVLFHKIRSKNGIEGLAVTDLRVVPMDIKKVQLINQIVVNSIQKKLSTEIHESDIDADDFEKYFQGYFSNH